MKPSVILRRARELIATWGHARGTFEDSNGALCAAGAIDMAVFGRGAPVFLANDYWRENYNKACATLRSLFDDHDPSIGRWNDRTPTSEVLAAFERAALACEERGE